MAFNKSVTLISLAFFCGLIVAADSVLYKWKDQEGNIQYGDRPPKGIPYERIKVHGSKSDNTTPSPITEKMKEKDQDNTALEDQLSKAREQMSEVCKIAKANLDTLNNAERIGVDAEDGGRRIMTDEERAQKKVHTQIQIDKNCKNEKN